MKRVSNLYEKINDIDIIIDMYDNVVSKNTKNKEKINKFNDYYSINIVNIKNIINSGNYIPFKYNIFLIYWTLYPLNLKSKIKSMSFNVSL